jgi:hypothetical protein
LSFGEPFTNIQIDPIVIGPARAKKIDCGCTRKS